MSGLDGSALGSRRVLIVEDLYLVADDLCRICRRHGGEVVGPVPDVSRARRLAADEPRIKKRPAAAGRRS